ncbi:unnamed protein product, partial [Urochloa humidicola]
SSSSIAPTREGLGGATGAGMGRNGAGRGCLAPLPGSLVPTPTLVRPRFDPCSSPSRPALMPRNRGGLSTAFEKVSRWDGAGVLARWL